VAALTSSPVEGAVPYAEPPESIAGMGKPAAALGRASPSQQNFHTGAPLPEETLPFPHLLSLRGDAPASTGGSGAPSPGDPQASKEAEGCSACTWAALRLWR